MKTFSLQIITPEKIVFECDDALRLDVPTKAGRIGIMANHTAMLSLLRSGEVNVIKADKGQKETSMAVSEGVVEVRQDGKVIVLADTAEHAAHIDIDRAIRAKQRAEDMMKEKEIIKKEDFAKSTAFLEKELARIKVGNRGRK